MSPPDIVGIFEVDDAWPSSARDDLLDLFKVVGESRFTPTREVVRGETETVERYLTSQSFRWYLNDLPARLKSTLATTQSAVEVSLAAADFLTKIGWAESKWGAALSIVEQASPGSPVTSYATTYLEPSTSTPAVAVANHVVYSLVLNGVPLSSPARLRVMIDGDGSVCEVTLLARLASAPPVQTVSLASIQARVADVQGRIDADPDFNAKVHVDDLRYLALPPHTPQRALIPVFEARGTRGAELLPVVRFYPAFKPNQATAEWLSALSAHVVL